MIRERDDDLVKKIDTMSAYMKGAHIQMSRRDRPNDWFDCPNPTWNWADYDYRYAPKPSYKPFINKDQFIQSLESHSAMPYVLLNGEYRIVSQIYDEGITIAESNYTYKELVSRNIRFLDGAVCGIPV